MNVDEWSLSLVNAWLTLIFPYRNKSYLKAQKKRHNQQQLCKVSYDASFILSFQLSSFGRIFAHLNPNISPAQKRLGNSARRRSSAQHWPWNQSLYAVNSLVSCLCLWCISVGLCFTVCILTKKHLALLTAGLERKLQVSADTAEQLSKDKTKLQNDMSDMMKESGDSSVQLTKMNQDLTEKERYQTLTPCTISSS